MSLSDISPDATSLSTIDAAAAAVPKRWAAGHVIIAVVVALLLGALLNAQDLLATAERQEFGATRTLAVGIAEPLASISHALLLDRPRDVIDSALGQGVDDVVIAAADNNEPSLPDGQIDVATPSTESESETPSATATPTEPEVTGGRGADRPVTAEDPLTVYIGGDSMVGQFGAALEDVLFKTGVVETTEVKYEFESGLTRPDFVDWPARLQGVSLAQDPDVMVLFFGGNDAQPLKLDNVVYEPSAPEWQAEYRSRVAGVMTQLVEAGHIVYWMGMPIPEEANFEAKMEILNEIYSSEADAHGDQVRFFRSWELFAGSNGRYSEFLPDDDGDVVDMRLDDGIHLTTAGAYRMARALAPVIAEDFDFPDPPTGE